MCLGYKLSSSIRRIINLTLKREIRRKADSRASIEPRSFISFIVEPHTSKFINLQLYISLSFYTTPHTVPPQLSPHCSILPTAPYCSIQYNSLLLYRPHPELVGYFVLH